MFELAILHLYLATWRPCFITDWRLSLMFDRAALESGFTARLIPSSRVAPLMSAKRAQSAAQRVSA